MLRTRLSIQMYFQFAIWGSWATVMFTHLRNIGFDAGQCGMILSTGPLALMVSPLIAGQIVDRYFSTERFLAFAYVCTGLCFYGASRLNSAEYTQMWMYMFGSMLFYGPTLGLGNSIVFHHVPNAAASFPAIRMLGTIGFICAAFMVSTVQSWFNIDLHACLYVATGLCALNAVYCLTLPHTPPAKRDALAANSEPQGSATGKIFKLLRDPSFALFTVIAFFMLVFATPYYFRTGDFFKTHLGMNDKQIGPVQTIGQAAEILTMLALPLVYKFAGPKKTIALGLLAWTLRFVAFSIGSPAWLVVGAQSLHGACFAFGIAAAMIYFDSICDSDARGSMQSFLTWIAYGFGMFVGGAVAMPLMSKYSQIPDAANPGQTVLDWHTFWMIPAVGCFILFVVFMIGFKERPAQKRTEAA
ncbi:MAG: MFS transporter [Planctomycetota bacterium]